MVYEFNEEQLLLKFMTVIKYDDEVRSHRSTTLTEAFTRGQDLEREEDARTSGRERAMMKKLNRPRDTAYIAEYKRGVERRDICFKYRDTGKCKFGKKCKFKPEGESKEDSEEDSDTECHLCGKSDHSAEECKKRKEVANSAITEKLVRFMDSDSEDSYDEV